MRWQGLHGGEGPIRIDHTLDRLVCHGFMVIGEAACMVAPINGNGVASGMWAGYLAAHVAAEVLKKGEPTTEALWPYAARYHRGLGAILASYDALRRLTDSLRPDQVADMLESGLFASEDVIATSLARPLSLSPISLGRRISGLATHPGLAKPILKTATASTRILRHYRRYPESFKRSSFASWAEKSRRLFEPL